MRISRICCKFRLPTVNLKSMEKPVILEYYSKLVKEEPLSTLEPEMTSGNTCVLESTSPFFGYYHDAPMGRPDPYIYCVLADHYSFGDIMRATGQINSKRRKPVDVAVGKLYLLDRICHMIRLKDIGHFSQVQIVQQDFRKVGIEFKKRQRTVRDKMAIIRLAKFLRLTDQGDGLFMDAEDATKGYFRIPSYINWESFKKLTEEAKFDTSILYFDAAQAALYHHDQVIDLVRVYKENIGINALKAIRDRYYQLLQ